MSLTRSKARPAGTDSLLGVLRSVDPILLLTSLLLTALGIFAVYMAGTEARASYATNQALGFVVGLVGAVPLALVDYRILRRYLRPIYGAVLLMLLAVTVLGVAAGGAQRWIAVGGVQVQPSEFAKLMMVVVLAGYLSKHPIGEYGTFFKALGVVCVPALLVLVQPDLGTALVFGAVFFVMAFVGGASPFMLGGLAAAGAGLFVLGVKLKILQEYQVARLTAFLDPNCADDISYQVCQSKTAIGSGGLTGKGLGATGTFSDLGYLPEDHTDFIFANLSERVGFVGSLLLLALFLVLIWRILHVATISRDRFGVLLAVGVATIFLFHVFVNVGMTMGMMPVTGIPLPFISYGRSSLVISVVSLGLLQSVAMRSRSEVSKRPDV